MLKWRLKHSRIISKKKLEESANIVKTKIKRASAIFTDPSEFLSIVKPKKRQAGMEMLRSLTETEIEDDERSDLRRKRKLSKMVT